MLKRLSNILTALLLLVPCALFADDFKLDEIEVTASRLQTPAEPFRVVTTIPNELIVALPVANVADLLAYLPGLDVRSRGTSYAQSDVSLHGGTPDQLLVLLNGIPLMDAQTGHYAMNIPVCPELIERIEILQNAASAVSGALTGEINIITRDAHEDTYRLRLAAGTNADVTPVFVGNWLRGEARINAAVEYARSNGAYVPHPNTVEQQAAANTDYQLANLYFQTRWRGLDVQAGAQYKDAGIGMGYGYASVDQFDATRTLFASGRYVHPLTDAWRLTAQAAYRGQHDRYEWHRGRPTNRHWTHSAHAMVQAQYTSAFGQTSFGLTAHDDFIRSTNMGEHNRWQLSLHAAHHFYRNGFTASLGLAGHYHSWCGWYGSGDANVGYAFLSSGFVGLSASRALRMPTWTDLFYHAGVQRGNTNLKAEKAWQLALNAHYTWSWQQAGQLYLAANTYYRWGQDIIDWNFNSSDSLFYATNHNTVNTFGVEAVVEYRYNRWLRALSLRYAYTSLSLDLTKTKSYYLDYLRHKLTLHLNHAFYVWSKGCVGADWALRWQMREQPVLLLDGSLFLELPVVRVALEGTNITNRHYYDYTGVLMPGAHGRITISATL